MANNLSDYYRLPIDLRNLTSTESPSGEVGFFGYGAETICYGRCKSGVVSKLNGSKLPDASKELRLNGLEVQLPFNISDVIENIRRERYMMTAASNKKLLMNSPLIRESYYLLRTVLPDSLRRHLQRIYFSDWRKLQFPKWPVDFTVDTLHEEHLRLLMEANGLRKIPFIWFWPDGAPSCLILTHDVETHAGRDFTPALMDLDAAYGFTASFQVVPEKRYEVPGEYVQQIRERGFEFNVHDLNHDGHLFKDRQEFLRRAKKINEYARKYNAEGFRAGAMYHNTDWYDAFEFSYDMSVANVAHLEPQRGGCCTVMPYFIGNIVELPLTMTQDYSLLYMLKMTSIDLWKQQIALIGNRNGLMSMISHPDYLIDQKNRAVYESLLAYLQEIVDRDKIWAALPGDVDRWWRARSQMRLIRKEDRWEVEGPESHRARVAYATLSNGRIVYEVEGVPLRECRQS
jgi:hypothetical protein